jgi:DNA-binding response OmpR family regulator
MTEDKKRILVVDDDRGILRTFKGILEKAGYVVDTVETGREALEKIEKQKFSLLLIDVKLPDMDGTEILRRMVNDSETVKIIVTGFSSQEVGEKAADYGADDFLVKPVKGEELLSAVKERLETKLTLNEQVSC